MILKYPEIMDDDSWGAKMIKKASEGSIDGMKTRAKWIAVRVNIHIEKQLALSLLGDSDEEEEEEEEEDSI